jgi:hypothetical protein
MLEQRLGRRLAPDKPGLKPKGVRDRAGERAVAAKIRVNCHRNTIKIRVNCHRNTIGVLQQDDPNGTIRAVEQTLGDRIRLAEERLMQAMVEIRNRLPAVP